MHIKDWGDDAQKHSSRTNLLLYNICTVTFLHHDGNGDVHYYTFVLSIGLKGSNHEEVEKILTKDLAEIENTPHCFYSGHHCGSFWATTSLVADVRDRPACVETFFGIHSHSFGKRFWYSMYHEKNSKTMSCTTYYMSRCLHFMFASNDNMPILGARTTGCQVCADLDCLSVLVVINVVDSKQYAQFAVWLCLPRHLSIGLKGSNHEKAEKMLTKDLSEIENTPHCFYSGHHCGTFWATPSLVAGVRDHPACGETFFGIHSQSFGKRFWYSMYHEKNTKIISCTTYYMSRCLHFMFVRKIAAQA